MSAVVATDYALERKVSELYQQVQKLSDLEQRVRWIEAAREREQKDVLEAMRRKGDFWMHMMQFSVVTVLIVEIVWILNNALSR